MIGTKISFCRKKAGLSQEALATRLNISRQAVSRWETGEAVPDTEKIVQLSRLFQVSTDYLLLDEIKEPLTGQNPAGIQTGPANICGSILESVCWSSASLHSPSY